MLWGIIVMASWLPTGVEDMLQIKIVMQPSGRQFYKAVAELTGYSLDTLMGQVIKRFNFTRLKRLIHDLVYIYITIPGQEEIVRKIPLEHISIPKDCSLTLQEALEKAEHSFADFLGYLRRVYTPRRFSQLKAIAAASREFDPKELAKRPERRRW
ncbi:hypothetical protein MTATph1_CDS0089 [Moorella phage MTATph1]